MSKKSCGYYVRIYDIEMSELIDTLALEVKKQDITKNDILVKAIKYGIGQVITECGVDIDCLIKKSSEKYVKLLEKEKKLQEIKEQIDNQFRFTKVNNLIMRDLVCSIYNMLAKMNEDDYNIQYRLQEGEFDKLPERMLEKKRKYYEVM